MTRDKQELKDTQSANSEEIEPPKLPKVSMEKKWYHFWYLPPDHSPPEIYNWTLYGTMGVFGILGAARGYDEGNISGSIAQVSFKRFFGLSDETKSEEFIVDRESNIAAMVQLGSIPGALLAAWTVDKFGRLNALKGLCVVWIIGAVIQITSQNIGQLYAGRFIEGLAIGHTTTVGPTYISEVSPARIRGRLNSLFAGAVYIGYTLAQLTNYGVALHVSPDNNKPWIITTSLKIIIAGLIFIVSFIFCIESPRWLIKVGQNEKGIANLANLRHLPENHPYVVGELSDINDQVSAEKDANSGTNLWSKFVELFTVKSIRYRFWAIAFSSTMLSQWSGSSAISIYSTILFGYLGITGNDKLKWSAVLGIVKLTSSYLGAFFLIDLIGRRGSLYIGLTLQMVCICYFGIFLKVVPGAALGETLTLGQYHAAKAALAALFLSGTGWTIGFNNVQYLLGGEVFPLHIRSFAQSLTMVLHFANQYGNSKATTTMIANITNYGTMFFFVGVCFASIVWCWFFVPEVSGRTLESMEEIFNLPWHLVGRYGPKLCPDYSLTNKISYDSRHRSKPEVQVYDYEKSQDELVENVVTKRVA